MASEKLSELYVSNPITANQPGDIIYVVSGGVSKGMLVTDFFGMTTAIPQVTAGKFVLDGVAETYIIDRGDGADFINSGGWADVRLAKITAATAGSVFVNLELQNELTLDDCSTPSTPSSGAKIFSTGGVVYLLNSGGSAFALSRVIGGGSTSAGASLGPLATSSVGINITGVVAGDHISFYFDAPLANDITGTIVASASVSPGTVTITFYNTSPTNSLSLPTNLYIEVMR